MLAGIGAVQLIKRPGSSNTHAQAPEPASIFDANETEIKFMDPLNSPTAFLMDPETFVFHGKNAEKPENDWLNTPEQIEARALSALAILNPEEAKALFPVDPAEKAAGDLAAWAITHPHQASATAWANQSVEQQAAIQATINDFLNPKQD